MKFKTIYVDVLESNMTQSENNSKDEFVFMEVNKIETILKQLRFFCDHLSYSLFYDINYHPSVIDIFNMTRDLGFRFDMKITSLKFVDHLDEICQNNAVSSVSFCFVSLEKNGLFDTNKNVALLHKSINKLVGNAIHVIIDLPSKIPDTYQSNTLAFINELGLNLNSKLWEKGFQVNVDQYLTIRCCEHEDEVNDLPTKTIGRCYGAVIMLGVLGNADVIPCNHKNGKKIILGNMLEEQLSDILTNEPYVSISDGFYKNELVHPVCQHCARPRKNF